VAEDSVAAPVVAVVDSAAVPVAAVAADAAVAAVEGGRHVKI
jgi:hypothetical protein